jgi:DNA-binding response OmpR family regulator
MSKRASTVFLLDDNPLILDLLRRALEPHADVSAFNDSTDALLQCIAAPPDLIMCDYKMPGLDGRQFVQKLRARAETKAVRIVMLAAKTDIEEKLRPLADSVEEFVAKPFYVKELVPRVKRILERIYWEKIQKEGPREGVIRGRLAEMNMIDLLQSLELGQKTCSLKVTHDDESCSMFFSAGQINHAEVGGTSGDDAVYRVATWPDGTFEIDFNSRSDLQTTTRSTQGLLMEALRLVDEQNR